MKMLVQREEGLKKKIKIAFYPKMKKLAKKKQNHANYIANQIAEDLKVKIIINNVIMAQIKNAMKLL